MVLKSFFYSILYFFTPLLYNFQLELTSNCKGDIHLFFWKNFYIFRFRPNEIIYLHKILLPIKNLKIVVYCPSNETALFHLYSKINDKLLISDPEWKCNGYSVDTYYSPISDNLYHYPFNNSYWIGYHNESIISCYPPSDFFTKISNPCLRKSRTPTPTPIYEYNID